MTAVRCWSDLIRPTCPRCTFAGDRLRHDFWKLAAEANHRATLHKIATMDDGDEDARMPPTSRTIVVTPRKPVPAALDTPQAIRTLRERLAARRRNDRP